MANHSNNNIVCFGELLLRLSTPSSVKYAQTDHLDMIFGGSEANIAVSLSILGNNSTYITALPDNNLGKTAIQKLRAYGVDTKQIHTDNRRFGIYFTELGAGMRSTDVIYDRLNSSFSNIDTNTFDWESIFKAATWFHWSGISPALNANVTEVCLQAIREAKKRGVTVSADLNYRSKLWQYGKKPLEVMPELVSQCDVLLCDFTTAQLMLGIDSGLTNPESRSLTDNDFKKGYEAILTKYSNIKTLATSLRNEVNSSHHKLGGKLFHKGELYTARDYSCEDIKERIGGGDAFMAGLIHGLQHYSGKPQQAVEFATAAFTLKHTVYGDFNLSSKEEIEELLNGNTQGKIKR